MSLIPFVPGYHVGLGGTDIDHHFRIVASIDVLYGSYILIASRRRRFCPGFYHYGNDCALLTGNRIIVHIVDRSTFRDNDNVVSPGTARRSAFSIPETVPGRHPVPELELAGIAFDADLSAQQYGVRGAPLRRGPVLGQKLSLQSLRSHRRQALPSRMKTFSSSVR